MTKKQYFKWAGWLISLPFLLFIVLCVLIYIPPIQNYAVQTATRYASEATGMDISIGRISLKFPLDLVVHRTVVVDKQDTILNAERLTVKVQMLPLFRKKVELDGLELQKASVNTAGLIEGMCLKGELGHFFISSHGVELDPSTAVVNEVLLRDTRLSLLMADTTATDTTAQQTPLYWKINLHKVALENVDFRMELPLDSMDMNVSVGSVSLKDGFVDLHTSAYSARNVLLNEATCAVDIGHSTRRVKGLDPSHILLTDIHLEADSLYYVGNDIRARINDFRLKEQSGLEVVSTNGRLVSNHKAISIPSLKLKTASSYVEMNASMDWAAADAQQEGAITARLMAEIGKDDVLMLLPEQPKDFVRQYPTSPLQVRAGIDGNLKELRLTSFTVTLPTAFRLSAQGAIEAPLDTLRRKGTVALALESGNTRFLRPLTGGMVLPEGLELTGDFRIDGGQLSTGMKLLQDGEEQANLTADYHLQHDAYRADIGIRALNLHGFLPEDSLYTLSAWLKAEGEGTDPFSPTTRMQAEGRLDHLQYGSKVISGIRLNAGLQQSQATASLSAVDNVIDITTQLNAALHQQHIEADIRAQIDRIDLHGMNLTATPMKLAQQLDVHVETNLKETHSVRADMTNIRITTDKKNFKAKDLHAGFQSRPDSVRCFVNAGDLVFLFRTRLGLEQLTQRADWLGTEMGNQWKNKHIDQPKIKSMLPEAEFRILSGADNPVANLLSAKANLRYKRINVHLTTSPEEGLNGDAYLYQLRTDSLELDTIYFIARQDSVRFNLQSGVKALAKPWQEAFSVAVDGFIGASEARFTTEYLNGKGQRGAYIGFDAQLRKRGISLQVFPESPTLVYRTFRTNPDNYVFLSDHGRIHADLKLYDDRQTGLSFYSAPDSTVQQDLTLSLHNINFAEFKRIIPYMPDIAGSISAEAHYVQQEDQPMVAVETSIDQLAYNKEPLGNWSMSAVYLPLSNGEHTVDGFLTQNGIQIAAMNGSYLAEADQEGNDRLDANMTLAHFPLSIANAFIPDKMATLTGDLDGELAVVGPTARPVLNGELALDSVNINVPQASLNLRMDNRSVKIRDSRLLFDRYSIYTRGKNPFTITGEVNMTDLGNPRLDLTMDAQNFELINAKKTKDAMVHGKLYVDFRSTLKGGMDDLKMRGNMNILGSSNFTYVMQDSPLTVEDRLGETVMFVNFADTLSSHRQALPTLTLGGMDVLLTLHIDEAVQARVDLNASGSNYMLLEGGGDLSFQYQSDGSMLLNGRYSLMSGEMKYEMPIIPLKTFLIKEGSYIEWTGNMMNPNMSIQAYERMRASVAEEGQSSRMVTFNVGVNLTNRLENLGFTFTLEAPEDGTVQNELAAMSEEEKNKLAVTMLVTGMYMTDTNNTGSFNTNSMLNSFLQGQINNIAGSALKTIDLNFGMETNEQEDGSSSTDYNFQFAKRFWNNRFRVVIGGTISSGNNVQQDESFIDNISLEYRLDNSGTRYIKVFHDKNYESVLDGEVIETGAGIVLRKKVSKLSELFIFRKKKPKLTETDNEKKE